MKSLRLLLPLVILLLGMLTPGLARAAGALPPDPPTNVRAVALYSAATVSWTAPTHNGGSPISGYTVTAYRATTSEVVASREVLGSVTTVKIMGVDRPILQNGVAYVFTVTARNAVGQSLPSGFSNPVVPGPTAPDAPTNVRAAAGINSADVSWTAPYNGGSPITDYIVKAYLGASDTLVAGREVLAGTTNVHFMGVDRPILQNGVAYVFTVTAENAIGQSAESARSNQIVPGPTRPDAPGYVHAAAGAGSAVASWTAPADGGSQITAYHVVAYYGATNVVAGGTALAGWSTSATVSGLTNGTSYTFAVYAVNAAGQGPLSDRSNLVTPLSVPSPPTNVRALAGLGQATISWTVPASDGGSSITGYIITAYTGVASETRTLGAGRDATSAVMTNLSAGKTYAFTVTAINAIGRSAASAASNPVTLATTPGAPRNLSLTPGSASVTARWDAPASDGGSPVTGYQVTAWDGVHTPIATTVTTTSVTLTGLSNGTTYTVSVIAVNAAGLGSPASASVAPRNLPPTLTLPANQTVHYGDALALTISASGPEASDHLTISANGLPQGLSFRDAGNGTATVTGKAEAAAGAYPLTFSVTDGNNPAVSQTLTLTISRAAATLQPLTLKPIAVKNQGARAGSVALSVAIRGADDPNGPGTIGQAVPVTYTLTPLAGGAEYTGTATISADGGALRASYTFHRLPVNIYRVHIAIAGNYYEGAADTMLIVYNRAAHGTIRGQGDLLVNGAPAHFTFQVSYLKNGKVQGKLVYTDRESGADHVLKGNVSALVIKNHRAYFQGTGTLDGAPHHSFAVTAIDHQGAGDEFGLWVTDPNSATIDHYTASPSELTHGWVIVRHQ